MMHGVHVVQQRWRSLTTLGQRIAGTLHGGCGHAGGVSVALITFGAHLRMGTGGCHLSNGTERLSSGSEIESYLSLSTGG